MGFCTRATLAERGGLRRAGVCAATIFVNPTQFGPKEDLSRYRATSRATSRSARAQASRWSTRPRPATCTRRATRTYVNVEDVTQGLDGASRPGHLRGVATVVTKLLALFRPDVALFGEKDFQQLQVIRALARDLELGVEIVGQPTVREADGLAMSSRNAYLRLASASARSGCRAG